MFRLIRLTAHFNFSGLKEKWGFKNRNKSATSGEKKKKESEGLKSNVDKPVGDGGGEKKKKEEDDDDTEIWELVDLESPEGESAFTRPPRIPLPKWDRSRQRTEERDEASSDEEIMVPAVGSPLPPVQVFVKSEPTDDFKDHFPWPANDTATRHNKVGETTLGMTVIEPVGGGKDDPGNTSVVGDAGDSGG